MDNQNKNNQKNNKQGFGIIIITTLIAAVIVLGLYQFMEESTSKEIAYSEFLKMVDDGKVEEVRIGANELIITPKEEKVPGLKVKYFTGKVEDENLSQRLYEAGVKYGAEIPDSTSAMLFNILISIVLPFAFIWIGLSFLMRRMSKSGGMMGIGKSNAKMYVEKETGVTFRDVAGEDEAKESLQEVVDSAFVEMYVGVGASRVRDLFKEAQAMAPCIIFIDEIDAIGKSRDNAMGSNDEREQTLNQLLAEMDGFDTDKGLLILAATNRPEILDPALLRPGRFDRRIIVDKPDLKGRVDILKVHAKDVKMDETVDLEAIALATSGAVGSDLANMINEAAINAVKHGRKVVSQEDLFEAVEVVLVGKEKKDRIMNAEERRIVSYHEVGHALVSALQKDAEPVQKITIVPRTMGALGYVMHTPEEEKFLNTKKELEAMLVGMLGGRAAEEIVFDTVTTGASNDIEKATQVARAMITQYGMSEKFGLIGLESIQNRYLDGRPVMNCGEATAAEIDTEVMRILKEAYAEAKRLLSENRRALDEIAAFLIEKETITGKEFMEIFHKVQGIEDGTQEKEARISMKEVSTADVAQEDVTEENEAERNTLQESAAQEDAAQESGQDH